MSHVDFKRWQCHPVEFKGQEPHTLLCPMNVDGLMGDSGLQIGGINVNSVL